MKVKKILVQALAAIILFLILGGIYLFLPKYYNAMDSSLRDYFFIFRGPVATTGEVVIVDIDEKSLKELGQWPWNRNKVAQVIANLAEAGVGVVGLDIVFAENDNSSPHKVLTELGIPYNEDEIPNYDAMLAEVIANTPTIVGYVFALQNDGMPPKDSPSVNAMFIEQNKGEGESLFLPYRAILNIPIIQEGLSFDAIYAQSDSMATGARVALKKNGIDPKNIVITGIDYIKESRDAIKNGEQRASFLYQTAGKEGAQAAIDILNKKTVQKEVILETTIITKDNVDEIEPIF